MLVLSRKCGESIVIGNVVVHVSEILRGRVRIAVDAPGDVRILRGELHRYRNEFADTFEDAPECELASR